MWGESFAGRAYAPGLPPQNRENLALSVETLSVAGIMKNRHFAQAIADGQGFGRFFTMLQYQADRYGTQIIVADHLWLPEPRPHLKGSRGDVFIVCGDP